MMKLLATSWAASGSQVVVYLYRVYWSPIN